MRVFDAFDRIRIINLAHRTDRRAEMEVQLRRVGLSGDPRVEFFSAVKGETEGLFYSKGAHGVFRSQVTLLEQAAGAGESVLILEDDCDFLRQAADYEMPEAWDVFYGGYTASNPADLHNSNIIGAHFMGFSPDAAKAAAAYFSRYLDADFPPDPLAATDPGYNPGKRPGIDGGYVWFRRAHPDLVTVFAQLGVQRPSRTDIGQVSWFDRIPGLRQLAGVARRIRVGVRGAPSEMAQRNLDFGGLAEGRNGVD